MTSKFLRFLADAVFPSVFDVSFDFGVDCVEPSSAGPVIRQSEIPFLGVVTCTKCFQLLLDGSVAGTSATTVFEPSDYCEFVEINLCVCINFRTAVRQ